jgi:phospholipid/cholesterol/gamma-HCH transport system substrate-binding protein
MKRNAVETVLGAVVLLVASIFVYFAYNTAQVKAISGYQIEARFFKIGGLTTGSDVRVNGIKVGTVTRTFLDAKTFDAVIQMSIMEEVKLPTDTVASIGSEGIVGGKYIRITPGSAINVIAENELISQTKDFRSLEDQVGEIIFLAAGGSK